MIAIAIDDEPQALEVVKMLSSKIPFLNLAETFTDALEAMEYLQGHTVDLVFLDIKMPDISGLDWVKGLTDPPMVIFTTAYSEYAADSYELEAVDYLVKPIAFNRFLKAVNRAGKLRKQQTPTYIFVKSGFQYVRIDFERLLYIQGASNYVDFFTQNGKVTVRMKLADAGELLPESFVQIHRSFLVNLPHIQRVENNHVMIGEVKISIGAAYREEFVERLNQKGV
ncbi:MAG: LytTR family DNA-binding domain-containing protein [Bacteroidota bacterium]